MEKRRCWKKAALPGTPASTDTLPLLSLPRACARQQWQYHNKPASQTEQTYRCWQRQPAAWQLAAHPACAGPRGQSAVRLRPPPASEWGWGPRPPRLARSGAAVYVCPHRAPPRAGVRRAWGERGRDSRWCRGYGRRKSPCRFRRRRVGDASARSRFGQPRPLIPVLSPSISFVHGSNGCGAPQCYSGSSQQLLL